MNIVSIPLSELKRPERNVRHHPQKQIEELKRSLAMFGQTRPFVATEDGEIPRIRSSRPTRSESIRIRRKSRTKNARRPYWKTSRS